MRRLLLFLIVAGLGLLGCAFRPGAARAQCYPRFYPTYAPVVNTVVVREIVRDPVFYAVPTFVPLYSTGYVPPQPVAPALSAAPAFAPAQPQYQPRAAPAAAPATVCDDTKLDRILSAVTASQADLRSLTGRVEALERAHGTPALAPPAAPPPPPDPRPAPLSGGAALLSARCAACHTGGKLHADTSFVMYKPDRTPVVLSDSAIRKIGQQVRQGKMPLDPGTLHPAALKDDEYAAVQDYLDSLKAN